MEHFFLQSRFNDFDDLAHTVQAWDLDFQQLDRGAFKADLLQFATANSLIAHARFNRRFEQRGSAPPGRWTFAIFTKQSTPIVWHEQEISTDTIVVYKPGSEIDCVSRPGFEVFTISYTEELLNGIAANLGLPKMKELAGRSDNFACGSLELAESRWLLHQIIEAFNRHKSPRVSKPLVNELDYDLPKQILMTLAGSRPAESISAGLRNRAIKRTKEYLAEFPGEPVTVSRLCKIARVSERTLQYAFLDQYGISPKAYLKNFRLSGVRRELWKRDPLLTRVNDVASLWGFWHMGQFAADYRKLFGELPSATLQRRN